MQNHTAYPNITRLTLDMVSYNGGLHAQRAPNIGAEQDVKNLLDECLGAEGVYHKNLTVLDVWLGTLTTEQFMTVADGEEAEVKVLLAQAPPISNDATDSLTDFINALYEHCI